MSRFYNPYNFVRTPSRGAGADARPAGHVSHAESTLSGRLALRVTTLTPLLLPDQAGTTAGVTPLRRQHGSDDSEPDPLILGSSIRGMLSAYYEALTNSRLRVIDESLQSRPLINRGLAPNSPYDLLDESLRRASSPDLFSAADRLFGWVAPSSDRNGTGHASHIRFGTPRIVSPELCTESFLPLHLAPLMSPRISAFRFRVGVRTEEGAHALDDGTPRQAAESYNAGHRKPRALRGRWFAIHDRRLLVGVDEARESHPGRYWGRDLARSGGDTLKRWYEDSGSTKDGLGMTIDRWVKPGTAIEILVDFSNVPIADLRPLVWLVGNPKKITFQMGHGKTLGFGAVSISTDIARSDLVTAKDLRLRYSSLRPDQTHPPREAVEKSLTDWSALSIHDVGLPFVRNDQSGAGHLTDLERILTGVSDAPVHYPMLQRDDGTYSGTLPWWAANERRDGIKAALPGLDKAEFTLPYHPVKRRAHRARR